MYSTPRLRYVCIKFTEPFICLWSVSPRISWHWQATVQNSASKASGSVLWSTSSTKSATATARASLRGISLSAFVGVDNDNFIFRANLPRRRLKLLLCILVVAVYLNWGSSWLCLVGECVYDSLLLSCPGLPTMDQGSSAPPSAPGVFRSNADRYICKWFKQLSYS